MYDNYSLFSNETERLSFVSNLPCKFIDASATLHCFANCAPGDFAKFLKKLKAEYPAANATTAQLMHFIRANLSLHDASAHLKGLMQEFVTSHVGTISYSPDTLYKSIIEECRTKSKYTGTIDNFADLIQHKSVTKSQVNGWLSQIQLNNSVPDWSAISSELTYGAMEKTELGRQWHLYRMLALGAGDEAINRVRAKIRSELDSLVGSLLSLGPLTDDVFAKVWIFASTTISGVSASRIKVMIIYEVKTYEASGDVQEADQESADEEP